MLDRFLCKFFLIYSLIAFFIPINALSMLLTAVGLICVAGMLIMRSIKNKNFPFLVFSLFIVTYCIVPLNYLLGLDEHMIDRITFAETKYAVFLSAHCLLTFLSSFLIVAKFDVPMQCRMQSTYMQISNPAGYIICVVLAILCIVFGVTGENIFESGGYAQGDSERSSLYEYGIIFVALSLIYSKSRVQRDIIYVLCAIFMIKDLMYGGRISSIELILAIFMLRYLNSFSFAKVMAFVTLGYIFFQFWGYYRSGMSSSGFDVSEADGNAQYVVYASMRIHYMIEEGVLNWNNRIYSFICFLLSAFVPTSNLPALANLSSYKASEYYTGGGGLVSTFLYCWAWIPGIVVVARWVGKSVTKFFHSQSVYWRFYALLLIITTPRWFAYYPSQLIKYTIYGVLIFYLFNQFVKRT